LKAIGVVEYAALRLEGVLVDVVEDGHASSHARLHEVGLQSSPHLTRGRALADDGQLRVLDVVKDLHRRNPLVVIPRSEVSGSDTLVDGRVGSNGREVR
jgi:hypothetical protein